MYSNFKQLITRGVYKIFVQLFMALTLITISSCLISVNSQGFDHDKTIFPLDFVHALVSCDACHSQGVFQGTPTQCHSCHSRSGRIQASFASPLHIRTTQDCEYCHQSGNWYSVIKVDHFVVIGSCQSCHNGVTAEGKNPGHLQSGEVCDDCHRTFSWQDAVFDHSNTAAFCNSCHNGVIASGKNPEHIISTESCDDCHSSFSWTPVIRVDHDAITGSCISCHNGVIASAKNPEHIVSTETCDDCHDTLGWTPVKRVDHDAITGPCTSCHNAVIATGTPADHFVATQECDSCHITSNWSSIIFSHQSMGYPGDHRENLACTACHSSNSEIVSWSSPAYQPDCAACHEGDYRQNKHESSNDGFESVSLNRDCSGPCHQKSSFHRVTDREWDD